MAKSNDKSTNMEMSELNSKLGSMNVDEYSSQQSNAVHMSTTNAHSCGAQARKTGGCWKKKQWKKLDMASGRVVPEHSEPSSIAGRKVYNGPPATAFHLFPTLPIELRFKIWDYAALHPRFIEMERGLQVRNGYDLGRDICAGGDWRRRVSPVSRQPPAVFHVSRESREEAKKNYELRSFDTKTPNQTERYIYYNPDSDILYFGEDSCVSTMLFTFWDQPRERIPRVAVTLSCKAKCECGYDDDAYGANTDIGTMKALHGIYPPIIRESSKERWPGCPGLEEVFWVVPSNLWRREQGTIHASVNMRQATTNGLTKGQRNYKKSLLWNMHCVQDGTWICGTNEWQDKKPKFRFISFAPHPEYDGVNTTLRDGLGCSTPAINLLSRNNFDFIKNVERATGCEILITPQTYPKEDPREIGFVGTEESIKEAKKLVLEKLAISRSEQVYVHRVSDAWEEAWNYIRLVVPGQL